MRVDRDHDDHDAVAGQLAAVAQDLAPTSPMPEAVHERHAGLDALASRDPLAQLDDVAVLADQDVVVRDADLLGEPRVMLQSGRRSPWTGMNHRGRTSESISRSSSAAACPLACTASAGMWNTSAPVRYSPSTTRWIAGSLPGIRLTRTGPRCRPPGA